MLPTLIINICFWLVCYVLLYKKLKKKIIKKALMQSARQLIKERDDSIQQTYIKYTFLEEIANYIKENNTGRHSYFGFYTTASCRETTVGKFCSIADNVTLGTTFHPTDRLSTHPFTYFEPLRLTQSSPQIDFVFRKPVTVGNDVWIGKHVTIMDGITIGDGAIIGTHAVVTHDVPPYAIVVGVPAKILRYRFDEKTIEELLRLKWWDLDDETISTLPFCDVQACIEKLKKIRGEK